MGEFFAFFFIPELSGILAYDWNFYDFTKENSTNLSLLRSIRLIYESEIALNFVY